VGPEKNIRIGDILHAGERTLCLAAQASRWDADALWDEPGNKLPGYFQKPLRDFKSLLLNFMGRCDLFRTRSAYWLRIQRRRVVSSKRSGDFWAMQFWFNQKSWIALAMTINSSGWEGLVR